MIRIKESNILRNGLLTALTVATILFAFSGNAKAMTGEGIQTNPYLIYDCIDFQNIQQNLSAYYSVDNNIDCTDTVNWNNGLGFSPIGTAENPFKGYITGNSNVISNLTINRPTEAHVAMFSFTSGSTIKYIGFEKVNVKGLARTAGVVANHENSSTITYAYVTGQIDGIQANTGGLVAINETNSLISFSYADANVIGSGGTLGNNVGVLAGSNSGGSNINSSYSKGTVQGNLTVGGLVGYNWKSAIITDSYSDAKVTAASQGGGLVGANYAYAAINRSYAMGLVNVSTSAGGLVGIKESTATENNSFYNSQTSGKSDTGKGIAKTTAQMKLVATFPNWNFSYTWIADGTNPPTLRERNAPGIQLSTNPFGFTNSDVTITSITTDVGGSLYKRTKLPNGTYQTLVKNSYTVSTNGTYTYETEDNAGNKRVKEIVIDTIDKINPTGILTQSPTGLTNGNVLIHAVGSDAGVSGFQKIKRPDGVIVSDAITTYAASTNGTYTFWFTDNANNEIVQTITISNIDTIAPTTPILSATPTTPTNGDVTVTVTYPGDASVKQYSLNGGPWITYSTALTITANGKVDARAQDVAGNYSPVGIITIANIDKTPPANATFTANTTAPTNANVSVTVHYPVDGTTKQYKIGASGTWTTYSTALSIATNDTIYARSYDATGNISAETNYVVSNIDKVVPVIHLNPTSRTWAVTDVSVTVTLTDTGGSTYKQFRYKWTNNPVKPTTGWSSWSTSANTTLTQSTDGTHYLHVEAQDIAENTAYTYAGAYKIDKTPPLLSVDFSAILDQEVYSFIGTNKLLFSGVVNENNLENQVEVFYYVESKDTGAKLTTDDVLLFQQTSNVANTPFDGKFGITSTTENGVYTLVVYAKNHLGLTSSHKVDFEVANPTSKPSVTINVHPQPTGTWMKQLIDTYITDSGDVSLLAGATKKYEVTSSAAYPSAFTKDLPVDRKVTIQQVGMNYLHVQYTLEDGTVISTTAGPYLIDPAVVDHFTVTLEDESGANVTDWTNHNLTLVISDPTTVPVSGFVKQYRIENYHSDWQNYVPGTNISLEGNTRIFARIITNAGTSSEQKYVRTKIDKTAPTVSALQLDITSKGTYQVKVTAQDKESGILDVQLNTNQVLTKSGKQHELQNLTVKPTSVNLTDVAGNKTTGVSFLTEPTVSFTAPYDLRLERYTGNVEMELAGTKDIRYKTSNKLYTCTWSPCSLTVSTNGTITAIHQDGNKQTTKEIHIGNIDKTVLALKLIAKRDALDPTNIHFSWNYPISGGELTCTTDGSFTSVTGKTYNFKGENKTYNCTLKGMYGGELLVSSVILYADATFPVKEEPGIINRTKPKTTKVFVEESRLGTSYFINTKSDNYNHSDIPLPKNSITEN